MRILQGTFQGESKAGQGGSTAGTVKIGGADYPYSWNVYHTANGEYIQTAELNNYIGAEAEIKLDAGEDGVERVIDITLTQQATIPVSIGLQATVQAASSPEGFPQKVAGIGIVGIIIIVIILMIIFGGKKSVVS